MRQRGQNLEWPRQFMDKLEECGEVVAVVPPVHGTMKNHEGINTISMDVHITSKYITPADGVEDFFM